MIRVFAKRWAKLAYRFKEEREAAIYDINASAAQVRAGQRRETVKQLISEAETIEARIKQMDEMEEKGYWLCENGHEAPDQPDNKDWPRSGILCGQCDYKVPMKFISKATMSGQDQYESSKERKEAEKMAEANRQAAKPRWTPKSGHTWTPENRPTK